MQVVLEIGNGGNQGQKRWLRAGQRTRVGASEYADFVVPGDWQMAPVHFAVEATLDVCRFEQLDAAASTRVNGRVVARRTLRDGDVLEAGRTRFLVRVDGATASPNGPAATAAAGTGAIGTDRDDDFSFVVEETASGLVRIGPKDEATEYNAVVPRLEEDHAIALVVNKQSLGWGVDRELPELASATMLNQFLAFLPDQSGDRLLELLDRLWGRDAVIVIATKADSESLADQLRSVAASFSHPGILRAQLAAGPEGFVKNLLHQKEAVLVETDDTSWSVFGQETFQLDPG